MAFVTYIHTSIIIIPIERIIYLQSKTRNKASKKQRQPKQSKKKPRPKSKSTNAADTAVAANSWFLENSERKGRESRQQEERYVNQINDT